MDVDDDSALFDDFGIENDDFVRLLDNQEIQYQASQMPPQDDVPMPTVKLEPQLSGMEEVDEPNMVDIATGSNATYTQQEMKEIEDDFNFDLQRQGYGLYAGVRSSDNIMNELMNMKKQDKVKDHKIESLKHEVIKLTNRLKRGDTPMRDIANTSTDSSIFPDTSSFSVKRLDYEGRNGSYPRPIKKVMAHRAVTPAPLMQRPSPFTPASQRMDIAIHSAPVTTPAIDHKKIERQNTLLAVLLCDSFLKWRRNTHIQLGIDLTKNQLNELCQLEAKNLLPTKQCHPDSQKKCVLLANDFSESLLNYESHDVLYKIFNIFRLSLTLAHKENQHTIVVYIVSKIKLLIEAFAETIDMLYNELNRMDSTSTVSLVAASLKYFYKDINPGVPKNMVYHLPDVSELTLMELTTITHDYSIKPDIIAKIVKERIKPDAAKKGTLCILQIILIISKKVRQPLFVWLLNDISFTELLSNNMPENIIFKVLSVIDIYKKECYATACEKDLSIVKKLTDIIRSPPLGMPYEKTLHLQERTIYALQKITNGIVPLAISQSLYKEIVPALVESIEHKLSEQPIHVNPFFIDIREKYILDCISLLARLSEYSTKDEKYPPNILEKFIHNVSDNLDDVDRPIIQQIKSQIRRLKDNFSMNIIIVE